MTSHHEILIVGGGTAGLTVAARLRNLPDPPDVAIVEPSDKHYYQPLWTLVGGGVFPREVTERDEADFIPEGATWIRDAVSSFDPEAKAVTTRDGRTITYDQLVVAPGIQINWGAIEGLREALGQGGVCSNYSYDTVDGTWQALQAARRGRAIFTFPAGPLKCGGAPQKIMWLADHWFRKQGIRQDMDVVFATPGARIFGVDKYRRALEKLVAERDITTWFGRELVAVRGAENKAVFRAADGKEEVVDYTMLHVTPSQGPPDFVASSPLADEAGWVAVDKYTLQHPTFPDVFSLGDASGAPTAKTGAAVRKQAPVVVDNLMAHRAGQPLSARYDGYTSCPLVTGYGRLILAEFDYDGNPVESFPFDQAQERYSMYALKAYGLPRLYWHGMLRGRA